VTIGYNPISATRPRARFRTGVRAGRACGLGHVCVFGAQRGWRRGHSATLVRPSTTAARWRRSWRRRAAAWCWRAARWTRSAPSACAARRSGRAAMGRGRASQFAEFDACHSKVFSMQNHGGSGRRRPLGSRISLRLVILAAPACGHQISRLSVGLRGRPRRRAAA
jgi:hypothetical protein